MKLYLRYLFVEHKFEIFRVLLEFKYFTHSYNGLIDIRANSELDILKTFDTQLFNPLRILGPFLYFNTIRNWLTEAIFENLLAPFKRILISHRLTFIMQWMSPFDNVQSMRIIEKCLKSNRKITLCNQEPLWLAKK